jgi:hypothetical protein
MGDATPCQTPILHLTQPLVCWGIRRKRAMLEEEVVPGMHSFAEWSCKQSILQVHRN